MPEFGSPWSVRTHSDKDRLSDDRHFVTGEIDRIVERQRRQVAEALQFRQRVVVQSAALGGLTVHQPVDGQFVLLVEPAAVPFGRTLARPRAAQLGVGEVLADRLEVRTGAGRQRRLTDVVCERLVLAPDRGDDARNDLVRVVDGECVLGVGAVRGLGCRNGRNVGPHRGDTGLASILKFPQARRNINYPLWT